MRVFALSRARGWESTRFLIATRVAGHIEGNDRLTQIDVPNLDTISNYLEIEDNHYFRALNMGKLSSIGSYLLLEDNDQLLNVNLTSLETVADYVEIESNDVLSGLHLNSLASIGSSLQVTSNFALTQLSANKLTVITSHLEVSSNSLLVAARFRNLVSVGGYVYFYSNYQMDRVDMPKLTSVGSSSRYCNGGYYQICLSITTANVSMTLLDYSSYSVRRHRRRACRR